MIQLTDFGKISVLTLGIGLLLTVSVSAAIAVESASSPIYGYIAAWSGGFISVPAMFAWRKYVYEGLY